MNNHTSKKLEGLPYQTISVILQNLLNQENSIKSVDALLHIEKYNIINSLFLAQKKKEFMSYENFFMDKMSLFNGI